MSEHLKMPVHEQWICGHIATAMCAECHGELVRKANELASQRARLTAALTHALFLIDQLLTEMRLANVTPSAQIIFSKAEFDRQMRILLGHER